MSRFFWCLLPLILCENIWAQDQINLASSSWIVVSDSYSSENGINSSGSAFFFETTGRLIIRNEHGLFRTNYTQTKGGIEIAGQSFTLEQGEENRLTMVRLQDQRTWQLEGQIMSAPEIEPAPNEPPLFRTDGFYYREAKSTPTSYYYYRFLPGGEQLQLHTVLPPAEVAVYLNRAYVDNEEEVRGLLITPETKAEDGLGYRYVAAQIPSDKPDVEYNILDRGAAYKVEGDSIRLTEISKWSHYEDAYEREYMLGFVPSTQMSTWEGVQLSPGKPGIAHEVLPLPQIPEAEVVLTVVDEMPRFPGCEEVDDQKAQLKCSQLELLKFIYSNISYPELAIQSGIEGTVVITFIVEKNGRVSNATIARDIGGQCGQESLRVVNLMREQNINWISGKMYGRPVRVQFNLPVKFQLEDEDPEESKKKRRRRRGRG